MRDGTTAGDGPLKGAYAQLETAILRRFPPMADGKTRTNSPKSWRGHPLAAALWAMRQMEIDGEPVPIEEQKKHRPWPHRLYIGSLGSAYNVDVLREVGITHIVSIATGGGESGEIYPQHFRYLTISSEVNAGDNGSSEKERGLYEYFDTSYKFIQEALQTGGKVLVHCHQGLSQSATILTAFLMRQRRTSAAKALGIVRKTRSRALPKPLFMEELEKYEKEIKILTNETAKPALSKLGA
jgi:predicted protein tyrosine phosphatase